MSYRPPAALTKNESERLQKKATRGLGLCRLHTPVRRLGRTYLRHYGFHSGYELQDMA